MLYYDDTKGRKGRRIAAGMAAAGYVVLWVTLMLVVRFTFDTPDTGEGFLIDFGSADNALGMHDPADNNAAQQSAQTGALPHIDPADMLTQDYEDAPAVVQPDANRRREQESPQTRENDRTSAEQEQPREVNRRAIFPGRTEGSASTSQGTTQGEGNQGVQEGAAGGSAEGTGGGGGGVGFSLAGRSVVGSLPQPVYGPNKEGRVVVDITVDATGRVTRAVARGQGSTTNDSDLIRSAVDAARKARFNALDGEHPEQTGTITYNFILK